MMPTGAATREAFVSTPIKDINGIVARCREGARKQLLHPVHARKAALRSLLQLVKENESALLDAVHADVGKHRNEAYMTEMPLYNEIIYLLDHVDEWVEEKPAPMEGVMRFLGCTIKYDPLGCVLVIGAWNYPLSLLVNPVAGALCAGNTVVMKPSELAPATAQLVARLVPKYFSPEVVSVVNGGVEETTQLLQHNTFDHILYTGGGVVGRVVMAAAAKNLTPVTLELGGKSPTIVDATCKGQMGAVAARIAWAKYVNCGQTCVAPDYLLIHESVKDDFVRAFREKRMQMMKGNPNPSEDTSYGRMLNERHYQRVCKMLDGTCGRVVVGGETDPSTLRIGVTLLDDVKLDSLLMKEEIFGPLLPMITYRDEQEVIEFVNARPKPLALYIFSNNKAFIQRVKAQTSSGGVVVNDLLLHVAVDNLPFGGVGESGMGNYHGFASFKTFSHAKSIVNDTLTLESAKRVLCAPYTEKKLKYYRFFMDPRGEKPLLYKTATKVMTSRTVAGLLCFLAGVAFALGYDKLKWK